MEQLVIIAVVLLFSVLDAATRKQRRRAASEAQEERERGYESDSGTERPVLGAGDSALARLEGGRRGPGGGDAAIPRSASAQPRNQPAVPADLWDEIQRLARGGAPAVPAVRRETAPVTRGGTVPVRTRPIAASEIDPAAHTRATPGDAIHRTHPDYGKRPSVRKPAKDEVQLLERENDELTAVRKIFAGGAPALRRAVVLEEVLGPPAAMRGDPFEPVG